MNYKYSLSLHCFALLKKTPWHKWDLGTMWNILWGEFADEVVVAGLLDYLFLGLPLFFKYLFVKLEQAEGWETLRQCLLQPLALIFYGIACLPMVALAIPLVLSTIIFILPMQIVALFKLGESKVGVSIKKSEPIVPVISQPSDSLELPLFSRLPDNESLERRNVISPTHYAWFLQAPKPPEDQLSSFSEVPKLSN